MTPTFVGRAARATALLIAMASGGVTGAAAQSAPPAGPSPGAAAGAPAAAVAGDLEVTVKYTGAGQVSADREISVFLFSDANINASSVPLAVDVIATNGGKAQFTGLTVSPVYIAVVYDEAGTYSREGPPAPGTPVRVHAGADGKPLGVKVGKGAKALIQFDDSSRMQ